MPFSLQFGNNQHAIFTGIFSFQLFYPVIRVFLIQKIHIRLAVFSRNRHVVIVPMSMSITIVIVIVQFLIQQCSIFLIEQIHIGPAGRNRLQFYLIDTACFGLNPGIIVMAEMDFHFVYSPGLRVVVDACVERSPHCVRQVFQTGHVPLLLHKFRRGRIGIPCGPGRSGGFGRHRKRSHGIDIVLFPLHIHGLRKILLEYLQQGIARRKTALRLAILLIAGDNH